MKAEITRTRLVEQPSTEQPQSQIVSLILTHSPPQTLALAFLCVFPSPHPFPSYFFPFLLSLTLLWLLCADEIHSNSFVLFFFFKLRSLVQFLIFPFFFPLHSLCLLSLLSSVCWFLPPLHLPTPPFPISPHACTISSEAPLFYVSLDNGSDTLTSALT